MNGASWSVMVVLYGFDANHSNPDRSAQGPGAARTRPLRAPGSRVLRKRGLRGRPPGIHGEVKAADSGTLSPGRRAGSPVSLPLATFKWTRRRAPHSIGRSRPHFSTGRIEPQPGESAETLCAQIAFAARRFVWQAIVELSGAGGSVAGHAPPALGRDCRCRRRLNPNASTI